MENNNLWMISIVAIVAIVGMVCMFSGNKVSYAQQGADYVVSEENGDLTGQAGKFDVINAAIKACTGCSGTPSYNLPSDCAPESTVTCDSYTATYSTLQNSAVCQAYCRGTCYVYDFDAGMWDTRMISEDFTKACSSASSR